MARRLAEAWVTIEPHDAGFRVAAIKMIKQALAGVQGNVDIGINKSSLITVRKQMKDALAGVTQNVSIGVNKRSLATVRKLVQDALAGVTQNIRIGVNKSSLVAARAAVKAAFAMPARITVTASKASIAGMRAAIVAGLDGIKFSPTITASSLLKMRDMVQFALSNINIGSISSLAKLTAAIGAMNGAAGRAGGGAGGLAMIGRRFGWLGGFFRLTLNQLHWIVTGFFELAAVILPAAIAFAAWGAAAAPSIQAVVTQMQNLNTATAATEKMIGKSLPQVIGLKSAYTGLSDAVRPQVISLFGAAINGANAFTGKFAGTIMQVGKMFQIFAAKVDVGIASGSRFNGLMHAAIPALRNIGQVFGNLGSALLTLATKMPGVGEIVLQVLVAITKGLELLSRLPAPIIFTAFAVSAIVRYGKLIKDTLLAIGLAADRTRLKIVGFADSLLMLAFANPAIAALIVLAGVMAFLIVKFAMAKTVTEKWVASMESAVKAAPNINKLTLATSDLLRVNSKIGAAQRGVTTAVSQMGHESGVASRYVGAYGTAADAAGNKLKVLTSAQKFFIGQIGTVLTGGLAIAQMAGVNLTQAFALADLAGVNLSKTFTGNSQAAKVARQQVLNLLAGYKAMGQTGGILGADLNVINIQAGIQATKVSQLNSAWDAMVALGTNLQGTFITMLQGVLAIGDAATTSSVRIGTLHDSLGAFKANASLMNQVTAQALAMRSAFQASVGNAQSFFDALRVGATTGAVSQDQFRVAVASTIAQMLPLAAQSQTATAQLGLLAVQAGGPNTSNFQTLKKWVDKNAVSGQHFSDMVGQMTVALSSVSGVAKAFATTLQQDVVAALAAGAIPTANITRDTQKYVAALRAQGPGSKIAHNAQTTLLNDLLALHIPMNVAKQLIAQVTASVGKMGGQSKKTAQQVDQSAKQNMLNSKTQADVMIKHAKRATGIGKFFDDTRKYVTHVWNVMWNDTIGATIRFYKADQKWMNNLRHDISSRFDAIRHDVAHWWNMMWQNTVGRLRSGIGDSDRLIANFRHTVASEFDRVRHDTAAMWDRIWNDTIGRIIHGIGVAVGWFRSLPGKVHNALNSFHDMLRNLAADALNDFWNGLKSKVGGILGWIGNFAKGIVNIFKKIWGWFSPSRVMYAGGQALMEGLAGGIHAHAHKAKAAADAAAKAASGSFGGAHAGPGGGAPLQNAVLARRLFPWPMSMWQDFQNLVMAESGFNQYARNPSSGAYGIAQALPESKYPFAGQAAGGSNPTAQLTWMFQYIQSRYGNPVNAWSHEVAAHWYDSKSGNWLPPGLSLSMNKTGRHEFMKPQSWTGSSAHREAKPKVELVIRSGGSKMDNLLVEIVRKAVTVHGGGDVQLALGRKA